MQNTTKTIAAALLLSLVMAGSLKAQTFQGKVKYLVTHDWVKKIAGLDYMPAAHKERMAYMFASRATWSEYAYLSFSTQASRYEESEETPERYSGYSHKLDEYIIYRDLENSKTIDLIKLLGRVYMIEDETWNPQWKILNDMREIAGHICMNAQWTDTIKGQKIIAWFALDIPVSSGPERFGGLPGLILEVNINNGALIISAESISEEDMGGKIQPPSHKKARRIKNADYGNLIRKHVETRIKEQEPWFYGMSY